MFQTGLSLQTLLRQDLNKRSIIVY